jgi:hypothetical protein
VGVITGVLQNCPESELVVCWSTWSTCSIRNERGSMDFPFLTTERLVLRNLLPTDAADVLIIRGDPEVQKYDDPPVHTLQEAAEFIEEMRQAHAIPNGA